MSTNIKYGVTDARTYCNVSDATCFAKKLKFFWEKQTCHALEENVVVSFTSLKNLLLQTNHRHPRTQYPLLWQNKSCCTWLVHIVAFFGADKGMQAIESWKVQDVVEFFNSWFQKCSNNTSLTLKTCHSHTCFACPNLQSSAHYKQVSQFTIKVHILQSNIPIYNQVSQFDSACLLWLNSSILESYQPKSGVTLLRYGASTHWDWGSKCDCWLVGNGLFNGFSCQLLITLSCICGKGRSSSQDPEACHPQTLLVLGSSSNPKP